MLCAACAGALKGFTEKNVSEISETFSKKIKTGE